MLLHSILLFQGIWNEDIFNMKIVFCYLLHNEKQARALWLKQQ